MALSNESYIVNTETSGEVIVPIREIVPYLNVNFIGYQYYSYHSIMSQNMSNLADDIKALQDGGLAQTTFDLDALVQETRAAINLQILGIETGLNDKIVFLTDEAVSNTNTKLNNFDTELHGDGVNTFGVIGEINALTGIMGDNSTGLLHRIDIIETAVGDANSGGLVQQFNGISAIVTELANVVGSETTGLVEDVLVLQNRMTNNTTGALPRITRLETTLGDIDAGFIHQVNLNRDTLFGADDYAGLYHIVGNNTTGLIKDMQTNRHDIDNLTNSTDGRLDSLEGAVGHLTSTGLTDDVDVLQTRQLTIRENLGDTDASGVRLRVSNLEGLNIQAMRNTVYGDGADIEGLVSDTTDLRNDLDSLVASSNSNSGDTNTALALLDAKVDTNVADIDTLEADVATNTGNITTNTSDISSLSSSTDDRFANMPDQIKADLLTYNSFVFSPNVLNIMKNTTDDVIDSDIVDQFKSYFEVSGTYIPKNDIGKIPLNAWIDDVANDEGYKKSTETIIDDYLGSGSGMSQVEDNKNNIETLNGTVGLTGSVLNTTQAAIDELNDTIHGPTGSVTILNSGESTTGSVSKSIKDAITIYDSGLQTGTIAPINSKINALEAENDVVYQTIKESASEMQLDMVRYDTILPFLQQMFKRVNSDGEILDSEIDTIFNTVSEKVENLQQTLVKRDAIVYFTTGSPNSFDISIILDRDLKFAPINSTEYLIIKRVSDNYSTFSDLDDTTLDAANNLVIESGILLESLEARVYENSSDDTGVEVTDLTEDYRVSYATIDIFGQIKTRSFLVEARP